jgi:hypothetical protein
MTRRGLSLLELLLALMLTALIGGALAGMMGAVSTGVSTRRDVRSSMVSAHASTARLTAYVTPARSLLAVADESCVLWLADTRESGTVHASEIRWFSFDPVDGTLSVEFVSFPESWGEVARDLEDVEYGPQADWEAALDAYHAKDLIASIVLVDGLASVRFRADAAALAARHLSVDLTLDGDAGLVEVLVAATIRAPRAPA